MVNIKVYLDDNIDEDELIAFLRSNNFQVISPREISMRHKSDNEHLKCASLNNAILLTNDKNFPKDSNSKTIIHKGILILYKDNNKKKDITLTKIIKAFKNIEKQKIDLEKKVYPLNIFIY